MIVTDVVMIVNGTRTGIGIGLEFWLRKKTIFDIWIFALKGKKKGGWNVTFMLLLFMLDVVEKKEKEKMKKTEKKKKK